MRKTRIYYQSIDINFTDVKIDDFLSLHCKSIAIQNEFKSYREEEKGDDECDKSGAGASKQHRYTIGEEERRWNIAQEGEQVDHHYIHIVFHSDTVGSCHLCSKQKANIPVKKPKH